MILGPIKSTLKDNPIKKWNKNQEGRNVKNGIIEMLATIYYASALADYVA